MNNDSIDESVLLKRKIQAFKAYSSDQDLKNFDESEINIFDLKRAVSKEFIKLDNKRDIYKSFLEKQFDLDT
jgi:hypothetical protein